MNAPRALYLDKTGKKLVSEDHPDVAELLAAKGRPIPEKRLKFAGLTLEDVQQHVDADKPAEEAPAPAPQTVQKDRQR